jgi:hypothetical protein
LSTGVAASGAAARVTLRSLVAPRSRTTKVWLPAASGYRPALSTSFEPSATLAPSTLTIAVPRAMPASAAGLPGSTKATTATRAGALSSTIATWKPYPKETPDCDSASHSGVG